MTADGGDIAPGRFAGPANGFPTSGGERRAGQMVTPVSRRVDAPARRPHRPASRSARAVISPPTRVVVIDDCELVRHAVRDVLERAGDFEVVGEGGGGSEALPVVSATAPDLVVLDAGLSDRSVADLCLAVRERAPDAVCVVLTAFDDEAAHLDAVRAGAVGVLLKTVPPDELVTALRRAIAGELLLDADLVVRAIRQGRIDDAEPPELAGLSAQQRRVVELVGEGLTNREIGERMELSEKTIKNYMSMVLSALDMRRRTEVAALAARLDERRHRDVGALGRERPQEEH